MKTPEYTFMCWPTLDTAFDIHADSQEEALEKLGHLTDDIVSECIRKLRDVGGCEGGADFPFITDAEDYKGDEDV
jgi:hypothetical protein